MPTSKTTSMGGSAQNLFQNIRMLFFGMEKRGVTKLEADEEEYRLSSVRRGSLSAPVCVTSRQIEHPVCPRKHGDPRKHGNSLHGGNRDPQIVDAG